MRPSSMLRPLVSRDFLMLCLMLGGLYWLQPPRVVAQEGASTMVLTVTTDGTGEPLAGAEVTLNGSRQGVTDARGALRLAQLPAGPANIEVAALGHTARKFAVRIEPGVVTDITVALAPDPIRLASVAVTAATGFEERRRRGNGFFFTREDIEKRSPHQLTDLFRGLPGVQLTQVGGGTKVQMAGADKLRTSRDGRTGNELSLQELAARRLDPNFDAANPNKSSPRSRERFDDSGEPIMKPVGGAALEADGSLSPRDGIGDCPVQYYLDGAVFEPAFNGIISNEVPVASIQAVEVYRRVSEVPGILRRPGSECGVILIWTR